MLATLLSLASVCAAVPPVDPAETPQTLLYVRTTPTGAQILLNGKSLGGSDGLFPVKAGDYKIVVDLAGYQPHEQQISVRDGRITRVELTLTKRPAAKPATAAGPGTKEAPASGPAVEASPKDAKAVLSEFLEPNADCAALTRRLRPTHEDYLAVFEPEFAKRAEASYAQAWDSGRIVIEPKAGQTELLLNRATTDELKNWTPDVSRSFPGGYRGVAPKFNDGVTVYRFRFVKPGQTLGMAYDGLVYVNGRWRLFPEPWRVTSSRGEPSGSPAGRPAAASGLAGTEQDAEAMLSQFLKPDADRAALTKRLRPTHEDYLAVFEPGFAKEAESLHAKLWDSGQALIAPKEGQTELLLYHVTTADLKKWTEAASRDFPGGYRTVASKFNDGITVYRFKFVKPGETLGMAYDGLVYVNGHWRIFPKPWQVASSRAETKPGKAEPISFGPVIERVVNDDRSGKDWFIDLDKGVLHTPSAAAEGRGKPAQMLDWARRQGIDASGIKAGEGFLLGIDLEVAVIGGASWDDMDAARVAAAVGEEPAASLKDAKDQPAVAVGGGGRPAATLYGFRTREGGVGVLQVLGVADDGKGLKIRYRLVRRTSE